MNPPNLEPRTTGPAAPHVVTASTLMSSPIAAIDHTASLRQAVEQLAGGGIGALVVLHGSALVGVVSERDVVLHLALGADLDHLEVGEVMQGDVVTVTGGTTAAEAARAMVTADVRHLPVLVDDRVAGMLSVRDVVAALVTAVPPPLEA